MQIEDIKLNRSGTIIQERMNERAIKQTTLAKHIGISHASLSQWMNGHIVPSDRIARAVCKILELDFEQLRTKLQHERYLRESQALQRKYAEVLEQTESDI